MQNPEKKFIIQLAFDAVRRDKENGEAFRAALGTMAGLMSLGLLPFELGQRVIKCLSHLEFLKVTRKHNDTRD